MDRLTEQQIAAALSALPEWRLENKTITRRYRFHAFPAAMAFTNAVADEAERRNHHPFIAIDYKVVTLRLTSWHTGGLTQQDFDEATRFDNFYASHSSLD